MKTKLLGFASLAAVTALLFIVTPNVFAQSGGRVSNNGATSNQGAGDSLKIGPLRSDITAKPGETRKVRVYVQNLNTKPVTLKAINNDFIAGSKEDGTPSIILNDNEYAPTHSLKRFMQPMPNFTVAAGERKAVDVTIKVPASAQAGGYYGAIRFSPALPDGNASVSVAGSVTSLIVMTVPGNLIESLQLSSFDVRQDKKVVPRLSSPDNVDILVRLENKGNVQVAPFGEVYIQKDGKMVHSAKINDAKPVGLVLPDSTRRWEIPVKGLDNFGKYKVTAVVGYGGNGQTINVEKEIWIVPTMYIIGAIGAVLALMVLVFLIVMALKSYKRKILRGSRRRRY